MRNIIKGVKRDRQGIVQIIRDIRDDLDFPEETKEEERYCDIRLQVYPDGQWALRSGDSSYDQDHNGFWGCSSITDKTTVKTIRETVSDLIEQVEEDIAMSS